MFIIATTKHKYALIMLLALIAASLLMPVQRSQAAAPAFLVKDIFTYIPGQISTLIDIHGTLYFKTTSSGTPPWTQWRSDGTEAGTVPADFGANVVHPDVLRTFKDKMLLMADGTSTGSALYISDGTTAATQLLKDNFSPVISVEGPILGLIGDKALFLVQNADNGTDMWITNGTAAGTQFLITLNPNGNANPYGATLFKGIVYFAATSSSSNTEVWRSDGTVSGTYILKDINPNPSSQAPGLFTVLGDKLLFSASDGTTGLELWSTDGTEAGTSLVKDITPGSTGSFANIYPWRGGFPVVGQKAILEISADSFNKQLWSTDGTSQGTFKLLDLTPFYQGVISNGAVALFTHNSTALRVEPWRTDGTVAGTVPVGDIRTGPTGSEPRNYKLVGGLFMFNAGSNGNLGHEAWKSNGYAAGTALVADVNTGYDSSEPAEFTLSGKYIFFVADDGVHGRELFAIPRALVIPDGIYLPMVKAQ